MEERKPCHCKKSKCLKLYCECFATGLTCLKACACDGCHNCEKHASARQAAIDSILARRPDAFRSKIARSTRGLLHESGCHCKRSKCLKRYCECFQGGVHCSDKCRCLDCRNFDGSPELFRLRSYECMTSGKKRSRSTGTSSVGGSRRRSDASGSAGGSPESAGAAGEHVDALILAFDPGSTAFYEEVAVAAHPPSPQRATSSVVQDASSWLVPSDDDVLTAAHAAASLGPLSQPPASPPRQSSALAASPRRQPPSTPTASPASPPRAAPSPGEPADPSQPRLRRADARHALLTTAASVVSDPLLGPVRLGEPALQGFASQSLLARALASGEAAQACQRLVRGLVKAQVRDDAALVVTVAEDSVSMAELEARARTASSATAAAAAKPQARAPPPPPSSSSSSSSEPSQEPSARSQDTAATAEEERAKRMHKPGSVGYPRALAAAVVAGAVGASLDNDAQAEEAQGTPEEGGGGSPSRAGNDDEGGSAVWARRRAEVLRGSARVHSRARVSGDGVDRASAVTELCRRAFTLEVMSRSRDDRSGYPERRQELQDVRECLEQSAGPVEEGPGLPEEDERRLLEGLTQHINAMVERASKLAQRDRERHQRSRDAEVTLARSPPPGFASPAAGLLMLRSSYDAPSWVTGRGAAPPFRD